MIHFIYCILSTSEQIRNNSSQQFSTSVTDSLCKHLKDVPSWANRYITFFLLNYTSWFPAQKRLFPQDHCYLILLKSAVHAYTLGLLTEQYYFTRTLKYYTNSIIFTAKLTIIILQRKLLYNVFDEESVLCKKNCIQHSNFNFRP